MKNKIAVLAGLLMAGLVLFVNVTKVGAQEYLASAQFIEQIATSIEGVTEFHFRDYDSAAGTSMQGYEFYYNAAASAANGGLLSITSYNNYPNGGNWFSATWADGNHVFTRSGDTQWSRYVGVLNGCGSNGSGYQTLNYIVYNLCSWESHTAYWVTISGVRNGVREIFDSISVPPCSYRYITLSPGVWYSDIQFHYDLYWR